MLLSCESKKEPKNVNKEAVLYPENQIPVEPAGEPRAVDTSARPSVDSPQREGQASGVNPVAEPQSVESFFMDVVKNDDGTLKLMTQSEAITYCADLGARLPSTRDFAIYARTRGAEGISELVNGPPIARFAEKNVTNADGTSDRFYYSYGYYQTPLGNLGASVFWTSSRPPKLSNGINFEGKTGEMWGTSRNNKFAVRCRRVGTLPTLPPFTSVYMDPRNGLSWGSVLPGVYSNGCRTEEGLHVHNDHSRCNTRPGPNNLPLVEVSESAAAIACKQTGARLPTVFEYHSLIQNFDHTIDDRGVPDLTELGKSQMQNALGDNQRDFWTSSVIENPGAPPYYDPELPYRMQHAYAFFNRHSSTSYFYFTLRSDYLAVRCVLAR